MFSKREQLLKKTGEDGVGRYEYLKQLINEFSTTKSYEARKQTLANLANFAYDPINYEHIKQLHLIDLFLAQLSENAEELIHFSLAGLCNICCDPESKEHIIGLNGVYLVSQYLGHPNEEIALNALTTLFYLCESQSAVLPDDLLPKIVEYAQHDNPRLQNLGTLFLETYYTPEQVSLYRWYSLQPPETLTEGDQASLSKKITARDLDQFKVLSGDVNPVHSDGGGQRAVVHGAFLNSLVSCVMGTKLPGPGALVVKQTLNFPNKCYVDDTVTVTVRVVRARKIIKVAFTCDVRAENKTVLFGDAQLVLDKRTVGD